MPRPLDVGKVMQLAGESKAVNLDMSIGELAQSQLVDVVNAAAEPWDLICADWITIIRRGPRFDSILEVSAVADALGKSLQSINAARSK